MLNVHKEILKLEGVELSLLVRIVILLPKLVIRNTEWYLVNELLLICVEIHREIVTRLFLKLWWQWETPF